MIFLRLISVFPFAWFGVCILLSSTNAFLLPTPCSCSSSIDRKQQVTSPILHRHGHQFAWSSSFLLASSLSSSSIDDGGVEEEPQQQPQDEEVELVKRKLVRLCAAYDRGFGATQRAKQSVAELIQQLEDANRVTDVQMTDAANGASPLQGSWQLLWTTAQDVLVLNASPFSTVGAIYQVFELPIVTNIIDLLPRIQAVLPTSMNTNLETVVRAEVQTRATARTEDSPLRVGLEFEAVTIKPIQILGQRVETDTKLGGFLPPPVASFDLPKIPGTDSSTGPGYFDVTYLDEDLLIIQQNAPGGLFVLSKTEDYSP